MDKGTQPYAGSKGGNKSKTVDAATALEFGVPQQSTVNTMLSGLEGLRMTQQIPLDSLCGSSGTNPLAGIAGLNTSLQSA